MGLSYVLRESNIWGNDTELKQKDQKSLSEKKGFIFYGNRCIYYSVSLFSVSLILETKLLNLFPYSEFLTLSVKLLLIVSNK